MIQPRAYRMRLFLSAALLSLCSLALLASDTARLPRTFGSIDLGMTVTQFRQITNNKPSGCATCVEGEKLSEIPLTSLPETKAFFEQLGFRNADESTTVSCFFFKDRLYLIRVGEFGISSTQIARKLSRSFGPPDKSSSSNATVIMWSDKRTAMTVSDIGAGTTDIIVVDTQIQALLPNNVE